MKPTAYFLNTGRANTTDEAALIDALKNNRIAGAGLDVFSYEPLPPDNPLPTLKNVVLDAAQRRWRRRLARRLRADQRQPPAGGGWETAEKLGHPARLGGGMHMLRGRRGSGSCPRRARSRSPGRPAAR